MADIMISLSDLSDLPGLEYEIKRKIKEAAKEALMNAGENHIKIAKTNVEKAYVLGEKKISLLYAWSLIPPAIKKAQTSEQNEVTAKAIVHQKDGMVITGNLLSKISVGALKEEGEVISLELLSMASYSKNLEEGKLFGEDRGKPRRFFTKHLYYETIPKMEEELRKSIGDEFR